MARHLPSSVHKKYVGPIAVLSLVALVALWLALGNESKSKQITPPTATAPARPAADSPTPAADASAPAESATTTSTTAPAPTRVWNAPHLGTGNQAGSAGNNPTERTAVIDQPAVNLAQLAQGQTIVIPLFDGLEVQGTINLHQNDVGGTVRLGGGLDQNQGSFALSQTSAGISGQVLLRQQKTAYLISTLASGEIVLREVALARVLCDPFGREAAPVNAAAAPIEGPMQAPPELRSRPEAGAVLYLDFDGATVQDPQWNDGNTIVAAASSLGASEITEVWRRVKEDFWPFAINVTTLESDYTNATPGRRMRIIITPTNTADPDSGGVAYRDSFARGGTTYSSTIPAWVFNWSINGIAETISHEAGHTLGLSHDGRILPDEEYYSGHGFYTGLSWAPIMGNSDNATMTQWSKGQYPQADNPEDDLAIISGSQATPLYGATNNTGYANDDFGNSRADATSLAIASDTLPAQEGQISSSADVDFFSFSVAGPKQLTITVTPVNTVTKNANLDAEIELQDVNGAVLALASPDPDIRAVLFTTVPAGTYYLKVRGAGHAANVGQYDFGYSNYGSIGQYTLTGSMATVVGPSITANPQAQNLYAGTSLSLSATAIGTAPLTYTWKRNGNAVVNGGRVSGATTAFLSINEATVDDAGSYTLTVSNAAGSVTTAAAAITVTVPPAPTFIYHPTNIAAVQGNSISFYTYATSPVSISYQWYRNGVLIPDATSSSYYKYNVTAADAGNYYVTARNGGGTVSSDTAVVTVTLGNPPVIYTQPQAADLYVGQYYQIYVGVTSESPATYQWYRDGAAINGATSSYYYMSPAAATHAGEYSVTITNSAGSVTSNSAFVSVSSTMPPRITSQPSSNNYANLGNSASFYVSAEGPGPLTYQWYFNGTPIPSSNSYYYNIPFVAAGNFGEYQVVVSNANGSVASDTATLDLNPNSTSTTYWSEAREIGGVVYFLFKDSAKISRYDLATESWLPSWQLVNAPTAFAVTSDAVYIAYGVTVKKYSKTLANETVLLNGTNSFTWLDVAGDYLLTACSDSYYSTTIATYSITTGLSVSTRSYIYSATQGFSYSPVTRRIYGRTNGISPSDIYSIEIATDGTVAADDMDTPYHGSYPEGRRTFLIGNGSFVSDEGGVVYGGVDLVTVGSFGVQIRDAVADGASGYCTVNGTKVFRYDDKFRQLGTAQLSVYAARVWRKGDSLIAFAQPTTSSAAPAVQKIDIASIQPIPLPPPILGYAKKITADKLVIDEEGVIYVYNKALKQILRWSTTQRAYLPSLPLRSAARYLAYSAANRALYFDNGSTQVRKIDLSASNPADEAFYSAPQNIDGLQTAGNLLVVADPSGAWATHYVLSAAGLTLDWAEWNHPSREYTWSEANRRMYYFRDGMSPNDLMYEDISTAGEITALGDSPYHGEVTTSTPIRVSPSGAAVLLGSGQIYNGTTLNLVTTIASSVVDATWNGDSLYTLRAVSGGTKVQAYLASNYAVGNSAQLTGTPVGIFPLSADRLVVITSAQGYLQYWELAGGTLTQRNRIDTSITPTANDFNRDGKPDLVLQNPTTGGRSVRLMNGTTLITETGLGGLSNRWSIAATADFNSDGQPDLLLQNLQTGERRIRLMNGTTAGDDVSLGLVPEWSIAAAADFNGDGKPDIVWQHPTGLRHLWFMDGTTLIGDASLGSVAPEWSIAAAADFNGDGKPDIVWEHTSGQRYIWFMNGATVIGSDSLGTVPVEWSIAMAADFNGDGKTDILWQNTATRQCYLWYLNGVTQIAYADLGLLPAGWALAGVPVTTLPSGLTNTHDFNGDGRPDILWQNTNSLRHLWFMNGATRTGDTSLGNVPVEWSFAAAADFNDDGHADILLQNLTTGERKIRFMNGSTMASELSLETVPPDWSIAAVADFNNDGQYDLLWQHPTGLRHLWFMNGTTRVGDTSLGSVASDWSIAAAADFNGDGQSDIVWQHASGLRYIWFMNGATVIGDASLGSVPPEWSIAMAADFNGDGKPDILWQNTTTGQRYLWFMNRATTIDYADLGIVPLEWSIVK